MSEVTGGSGTPTDGMPWWARAATIFGVPTVFAGFLIWQIAGSHTTDVQTTKQLIEAHVQAAEQRDRNHEQHEQSLQKILRAICINGAESADDRVTCLQ